MESNVLRFLIKFVSGGICTTLAFLFGSFDGLMKTIVAFVVIDYITGVISAAYQKKLNSKVGSKGIVKKIMLFCVIAVANVLDTNVIGGNKALLRTMAIGFYSANEGLSILENVGKFVNYPKPLRNFLEQLRDKNDKEEK